MIKPQNFRDDVIRHMLVEQAIIGVFLAFLTGPLMIGVAFIFWFAVAIHYTFGVLK